MKNKILTYSLIVMSFLLILINSCKKDTVNTSNNNNPGWTQAQKDSYHHVITLQEQAAANYDTWTLTTDSLTVINQLQQFFAADASVTWAVISSQGISVQYKNGMRGGFFLFAQNKKSKNMKPKTDKGNTALTYRHLLNNKHATVLCPQYWDAGFGEAQTISTMGVDYMPKVGLGGDLIKNTGVDVNSFASLSGNGFIYISSHGMAYPSEQNLQLVYVKTGEVANDATAEEYYTELYTGDLLVGMSKVDAMGTKKNVYFVSPDFVKEYNDFSKDTIIFIGGFCYSSLGGWADIQHSFAAGGYFGFDWSVRSNWCNGWLDDLMYNMTDTSLVQSFTAKNWMDNSYPKLYYDTEDHRNININYFGDQNLTLWKRTTGNIVTTHASAVTSTTAMSGGNIISDGGSSITARGVCWSTSPNPVATGNHTIDGTGIGIFTSSITGLTANTLYYAKAYAKNSAGITYGNEISFTTPAQLAIGQSYQGGIIAGIYHSGNAGYVPGETHGIIAATSDQGTGTLWGCYGTLIGGTSQDYNTGQANTTAIVNGCSEAGAAKLCNDLVLNGYSDWYLPSYQEMGYIRDSYLLIGGINPNAYYWTSSEVDLESAWASIILGNGMVYMRKDNYSSFPLAVRAVRSF